jgi:uncharacterized cupredoxin-like copper-binding protein
MNRRFLIVTASLMALVLGACGGGSGTETKTERRLKALVQEWSVTTKKASIKAGNVTFTVLNKGPKHKHEFVVFKTDLDPGALPKKADGSVDESGAGLQLIGRIEPFKVNETKTGTFDLAAGKYVFVCNVVEAEAMPDMGGNTSHYKLGMRVAFTVT